MKNRNSKKHELANAILEQYQPETVEEMQDALKEIFGPMFESMLQGEMKSHLGYESNAKNLKENDNRRNGYNSKNIKTTYGEIPIDVPRDRNATFEPKIIPKRTKDVSAWQQRPLQKFYPFVFVDCLYVTIRKELETKNYAVYTILGYEKDGHKDLLGLWLNENESKHAWMQIFDEIKSRGVEDILFISMDGVSGLEDGAKAIFKDVVVQRCIVHLIRNSIKYVPSKDYKKFTLNLKKIYGASSLKASRAEFEKFKQNWSQYPSAVDVWERNFNHIEQLFDYGSSVRKIMYTTNAVESVHSSFRKVTKKGAFPNENALLKLLYLRIMELHKKWDLSQVQNWALVRNQLDMDPKFQERIRRYDV